MINSEELLLVVDENNRPIDPAPRSVVHEKHLWHRCSDIYVVNKNNQILCHKRAPTKDKHANMWDAGFGGHTNAGESDHATAQKELFEESGLRVEGLQHVLTYTTPGHNSFSAVYLYFWDGQQDDLTLEPDEVSEVAWFDTEYILEQYKNSSDWSSGLCDPELFAYIQGTSQASFEMVAELTATEFEDFGSVLDDYSPSQEVYDLFDNSSLCIIAGPAGSGKDTLRNALLEKYEESYNVLLCDTTRPPRITEIRAKNYRFVSKADMLLGLKNGEYLQGAIIHNQQVSGIHKLSLERIKGKNGLAILVVNTERELYAKNHNIKTVFLIPPSKDELMSRINDGRNLTEAEVSRRINSAVREIGEALETDRYFFWVSSEVDKSVDAVHEFFENSVVDPDAQLRAREIAQKILDELSL